MNAYGVAEKAIKEALEKFGHEMPEGILIEMRNAVTESLMRHYKYVIIPGWSAKELAKYESTAGE